MVEYEGFDNDEGNEHQHDLVLHLPQRKRAVNGDRRRRYLGGDGGVIDVTACLLPCHSGEEEELTNGPNSNGRELFMEENGPIYGLNYLDTLRVQNYLFHFIRLYLYSKIYIII